MIRIDTLISAGCNPTQARVFAGPLSAMCEHFKIITREQRAGVIAQAMHESECFTHLEEDLMYTNPVRIAQIFRSGFDLNGDRRISPDEIEVAKNYVRKPKELANRAYANRNGNGDEASGDGWNYRGSGPFQLTGKGNFEAFSSAVGIDYVAAPDHVRQDPTAGAMAAGWFWVSTGCNDLVSIAFDLTTKRINGPAMLGAKTRKSYFDLLLGILS
jgi:putative chitinase